MIISSWSKCLDVVRLVLITWHESNSYDITTEYSGVRLPHPIIYRFKSKEVTPTCQIHIEEEQSTKMVSLGIINTGIITIHLGIEER